MWRRLRYGIRLVTINVALLLAAATIIELVFGSWFSSQEPLPPRVQRNVAITFDARNYYPDGSVFHYRRDRFGLRGQYQDPSKIDILAIGGSTTNELYVGEGETWTDILAQLFEAGGTPISVVNAGMDGQSTIGHLNNFERWFPKIPGLRPRYVLAYVGINDVHLVNEDNYHRFDAPDAASPAQQLRRFARDRSALYDLYRTSIGTIRAKQTRLIHGSIQTNDVEWEETVLPGAIPSLAGQHAALSRAYGERVGHLIERIRAIGAEAIIVTQHRASYRRREDRLTVAVGGALSGGIHDYYLQTAFNGEAMEACRKGKAICIDLGAEIEFQPGDFQDYVHTTPQGSRRVAEFLHSRLKDRIR